MKKNSPNLWSIAPLVRIVLPLILGVTLASIVSFDQASVALISLVCLISLFLIHFRPWSLKFQLRVRVGIVVQVIALLTGFLLGNVHNSRIYNDLDSIPDETNWLLLEVASAPTLKPNSLRFEAQSTAVLVDDELREIKGGIMVTARPGQINVPEIGDYVWIKTIPRSITPPSNPGEFDYRAYMSDKGITHQIFLHDEADFLLGSSSFQKGNIFTRARDFLQSELDQLPLESDQISVVSALILGQKKTLDPELRQSFATAGAMHVLAVSGLHVGLIYLIFNKLFSLVVRVKQGAWIRALIVIILLWMYAGITGFSPSVLRATTMFTAIAFAQASSRRSNIYNTLSFSAIALIVFNPNIIYEVGFQLSYLAVVGIVFLQPKIYAWINSRNWLVDKIWQISSVSIAAQLATFPLSLYYFHMFPSYFLLSNLVVIPLAGILLSLGLAYFATFWFEWIQNLIGIVFSWSVELMSGSVSWIGNLAGAKLVVGDFGMIMMLLLYGLLFSTIGLCVYQRRIWAKIVLALGIGILLFEGIRNDQALEQREVVVYNVKGKPVIGVKRGTECWLLSDDIVSEKDLKFKIEPDLNASRIEETHFIVMNKEFYQIRRDMLLSKDVLLLGNKRMSGPMTAEYLAAMISRSNLTSWD